MGTVGLEAPTLASLAGRTTASAPTRSDSVREWTAKSPAEHPRLENDHLLSETAFCFNHLPDYRIGRLVALLMVDGYRPPRVQATQTPPPNHHGGSRSSLLLSLSTLGVYRLKPAAPSVERGTVWTDTVKRGPMLRQVRGLGTLIPSQESVRQIPAETEATVVRIRVLPGSQVKADTILLEMSNPQVEQAAVDAQLQLKAAEAEYQSLRVKLESDLMNQKAGAATVNADYSQAQLQAETDKALYELGVISGLAYKTSKGKADELTTRNDFEDQRLTINQKAIEPQMAEQQAKVDQMRALAELKQKQLDALKVRAGIDGVLVDLPLQVGQHVTAGNDAGESSAAEPPDGGTENRGDAGARRADRRAGFGRYAQRRDRRHVYARRSRGAERNGHGRREAHRRTSQGRAPGPERRWNHRSGKAGQRAVRGASGVRAGKQHDQSVQA